MIGHQAETLAMMGAVDLDHQSGRSPADVQVDAAARRPHDDLAIRLGQPTLPAHLREVELAQGLRTVRDVLHQLRDERASPATGPGIGGRLQLRAGDEPLLDRQDEEEGGLSVGRRPVRGANAGYGGSDPGYAPTHDDLMVDPLHPMETHAPDASPVSGARNGDVHDALVKPGRPTGQQGADAVEHSDAGAGLPDRPPPP